MADITKRLHYFNGQFLEEKDFSDEQKYHLDRQRRHNRLLHTYGIAEGLTVTAPVGAGEVTVGIGTALDNLGQMLVLSGGESLSLANFANKTVYVVISYREVGVDPATVGNQGQPTRLEEHPKVELVETGTAPPEGTHIRLARVVVGGDRTVSALDLSVRQPAGVRVGGELAIPRLRLSHEQLANNRWPEMTSDADGRVRVHPHLSVTGDVTVGGTLSGTLGAGLVKTANVADLAVTAEKLADLAVGTTKLANLAVTEAKLADNAVTNAKLADNAVGTNEIANLAVTSGKIANLGVTTGKLADLAVTDAKIADSAVTTAKLADFAVTTNEIANNAVNGSKISNQAISADKLDEATRALLEGALQQETYEYQARSYVAVVFSGNDIDGATRTVDAYIRPRLLFITGYVSADLAGAYQGGTLVGFADLSSRMDQRAAGPRVERIAAIPYLSYGSTISQQHCAHAVFYDATTAPRRMVRIDISVASVEETRIVFRLGKSALEKQDLLANFDVFLNILCLGQPA